MNLKKIISGIAKDKMAERAIREIAPMDEAPAPKGWKVKAAGVLAVIATIAGALSQFLGGA
jgi:hypothetical protein